nr:hypothetical protein HmN_000875000 [Hymenolepis microstoma]
MSKIASPMWCVEEQISATSYDSQSALNKSDETEPRSRLAKGLLTSIDEFQDLLMELRDAQHAMYQIPAGFEQHPITANDDETDESLEDFAFSGFESITKIIAEVLNEAECNGIHERKRGVDGSNLYNS